MSPTFSECLNATNNSTILNSADTYQIAIKFKKFSFELRMETILVLMMIAVFYASQAEAKGRPERDPNGMTFVCRCSAPVQLSGQLGAGHYVGQW